ncbi:MAG: 3-dehydroquinate synthase [Actinomycetia bacterium]|nr:3-dehydroquinate synthase [Actinomycetes bacterium]
MHRVGVELGPRSYDIVVGDGAAGDLATLLSGRARVAVVTQTRVAELHGEAVQVALAATEANVETFTIGDGEEHKNLATIEALCRGFTRFGLRRNDAVVALGGGMVGDVAGFAAAVHYRGVAVVQVPTTLLAMVDAAIGGKTAVNLPEGKNLVGAFHQPVGVLADPRVLVTLPEREYRSGLGEIAKYALLGDRDLAHLVENEGEALVARERRIVSDAVARCAAIKARYVEADEEERLGLRAHLNYGHTLAHALETVCGYALAHGEAVAIGLVFAAELAGALERIDTAEVDRQRALVESLGVGTRAPDGVAATDLLAVMARDKKSSGGLTFVLAGANGLDVVDDPPPVALRAAFAAVGVTEGA